MVRGKAACRSRNPPPQRSNPLAARIRRAAANAIPIWFVTKESWDEVRQALAAPAPRSPPPLALSRRRARCQLLPDAQGGLAAVVFGVESAGSRDRDPMLAGKLAGALPAGIYRFANATGRREPVGAGLSARALSLFALSRSPQGAAAPRRAGGDRRRAAREHRAGRSPSAAISSIRRPTTSAPTRWRARPSSSRKASAPAPKSSAATISSRAACRSFTRSGAPRRSRPASSISSGVAPTRPR